VDTHEPERGVVELVAYFTAQPGEAVDVDGAHEILRDRLPRYMLPAYYEQLGRIPTLPSDKADRKNLPAPSRRRRAASGGYDAPETPVERVLAEEVAALLGLDRVSVTAHLFDDLGMNSLLMAQLCTRLRNHPELPPVTMREIYLNPTLRGLAASLPDVRRQASVGRRAVRTASTAAYVASGAVQAACYLGLAYLVAALGVAGYGWMAAATGLVDTYLRAVGAGAALLGVLTVLPVLAKWLLVGRFRPGEIRLWSPAYLRFWAYRQLLRVGPGRLLVGTPLYGAYLRLLGVRVGPGAVVLTANPPVCADVVSIGAGAVVRKDALFNGYRAESGVLRIGRVEVGDRADVGENSVLDVDTALGEGARLAHASALHAGQRVPAGRRFHGSPAVDAGAVPPAIGSRAGLRRRRATFAALQLAGLLFGWGPLSTGVLFV
jgi:hypothetical protein